jgi:hypothetical protein
MTIHFCEFLAATFDFAICNYNVNILRHGCHVIKISVKQK